MNTKRVGSSSSSRRIKRSSSKRIKRSSSKRTKRSSSRRTRRSSSKRTRRSSSKRTRHKKNRRYKRKTSSDPIRSLSKSHKYATAGSQESPQAQRQRTDSAAVAAASAVVGRHGPFANAERLYRPNADAPAAADADDADAAASADAAPPAALAAAPAPLAAPPGSFPWEDPSYSEPHGFTFKEELVELDDGKELDDGIKTKEQTSEMIPVRLPEPELV